MNDLLYINTREQFKGLQETLPVKFPEAHIDNVTDDIHGFRLSVELSDDKRIEFLEWLAVEGHLATSFMARMMAMNGDQRLAPIIEMAKVPVEK